ncbi:MAG: hypothetical protein RLZZ37_183 [Actinomycetota bacterium]|jgi:predicted DNA-binding transcriptional regulator YafY
MNDSKIERQLNLFFILLNSNRPVTRQEIKNKILDYRNNESDKAFERMFERDKDDLRKNGIRISAVNTDALFDDEIGYLIDKETFISKKIELSDEERLTLKYSLSLWNENNIISNKDNIFRKIGISNTDFEELVELKIQSSLLDIHQKVLKAIISRQEIEIFYLSAHQDEPIWRRIQPIQILNQNREIFLKAFDLKEKKIKTYRIENITDLVVLEQKFSKLLNDETTEESPKVVKIKLKNNTEYYENILKGVRVSKDTIEILVYNYVASARFLLPFLQVIEEIFDEKLKETVVSELKKIYEAVHG